MIISVDCNSDTIKITKGNQTVEMPCKYPINTIKILVELLNLMDIEGGVILEKIDEDSKTIVEEW